MFFPNSPAGFSGRRLFRRPAFFGAGEVDLRWPDVAAGRGLFPTSGWGRGARAGGRLAVWFGAEWRGGYFSGRR